MLKEFAVDPAVIASSFDTCRYLISQFGADKGRLIAKYPNRWKRLAFEAADQLPDGLKKERVIEYINSLGRDWLDLISSNREYAAPGDTWLNNAITAHAENPFSAIICDRDDPPNKLIDASTCDETNPLFSSRRTYSINRSAHDFARDAEMLLINCRQLRFIDPYFDPRFPRWRAPLEEILQLVPDITRVEAEYHIHVREATRYRRGSPSTNELKIHLEQLNGVIPPGGSLRIVRWKGREDGERVHRRFLLSENAGLGYEGGLDAAADGNQTTDVFLMDREHHAERWAEYNLDAEVYELVEPVLLVDADGNVTELAAEDI